MNRSIRSFYTMSSIAFAASLLVAELPAGAGNWNPYEKLQLNNNQRQRISAYERRWNSQYMQLSPQLRQQQEKLLNLLSNSDSDPIEVTQTQQKINSLKEQLSNHATMNMLQKRRVLNPEQRRHLRRMMDNMLSNRQFK